MNLWLLGFVVFMACLCQKKEKKRKMKKAIKIERKTLKIKRYVGKIDTLWAKNWEEYELKAF